MSNTVLIKEVNNSPVIFNVDNAVDAARLEALQAVKMADDLVASVFGEQSNFADNTTCTISANQDNPAFPYNVTFNASKIIDTPKRYYGNLAGMGMPSDKFISLNLSFNNKTAKYTAPANGYVCIYTAVNNGSQGGPTLRVYVYNYSNVYKYEKAIGAWNVYGVYAGVLCPVKKGDIIKIAYSGNTADDLITRFIYAEGEI